MVTGQLWGCPPPPPTTTARPFGIKCQRLAEENHVLGVGGEEAEASPGDSDTCGQDNQFPEDSRARKEQPT